MVDWLNKKSSERNINNIVLDLLDRELLKQKSKNNSKNKNGLNEKEISKLTNVIVALAKQNLK